VYSVLDILRALMCLDIGLGTRYTEFVGLVYCAVRTHRNRGRAYILLPVLRSNCIGNGRLLEYKTRIRSCIASACEMVRGSCGCWYVSYVNIRVGSTTQRGKGKL